MDYNLIKKYLSGHASEKEVEEVFTWIEASPENKQDFLRLKKLWSLTTVQETASAQSFKEIQKGIKQKHRRKGPLLWIKYAAIFIGCVVGSMFYFQKQTTSVSDPINEITLELEDGTIKTIQKNEDFKILGKDGRVVGQKEIGKLNYYADADNQNRGANRKLRYNTLRVPYGKRFDIQLSDGSIVHLNAGSKLRYPVEFIEGQTRKVFLDGEGYFLVAPDQKNSFIVMANRISTKVYGTEFNISSYKNEEQTRVVLVEGSVAVYENEDESNEAASIFLAPNDMASFDKLSELLEVKAIDVSSHVAWVDGALFFKNEPFNHILRKLERHYNVKISNQYHALDQERFTGMFRIENVEEVLNTFKRTTDFEFEINDQHIIINPKT